MGIPQTRIDKFNEAIKYLGLTPGFLKLVDKMCHECNNEYLISVNDRECYRCGTCQGIRDADQLSRQDLITMSNMRDSRLAREKEAAAKKGKKFY